MPEHAKKHHFVPQFLLRRFADKNGRLVVHRVATQGQYDSTVRNLGHRNNGHTLYHPNYEPDPATLEAEMAQIEGDAASAVRELDGSSSRSISPESRRALAWFLALQWQRSRFLLHSITQEAAGVGGNLSPQQIQGAFLRMVQRDVIWPWQVRDDDDAAPDERFNYIVGVLLSRHWSCYRPRAGGLLVGDCTLCFSGYAGSDPPPLPPGYFDHGVGCGIADFRRVTVPLGTHLAVIISADPAEAGRLDVAALNRFTVFNSREFVAHAPAWSHSASQLDSLLKLQRLVAPVFLKNYGAGGYA